MQLNANDLHLVKLTEDWMKFVVLVLLGLMFIPVSAAAQTCSGELIGSYRGRPQAPNEIYDLPEFWRRDLSGHKLQLTRSLREMRPVEDLRLYLRSDQSVWLYPFAKNDERKCVKIGRLQTSKLGVDSAKDEGPRAKRFFKSLVYEITLGLLADFICHKVR